MRAARNANLKLRLAGPTTVAPAPATAATAGSNEPFSHTAADELELLKPLTYSENSTPRYLPAGEILRPVAYLANNSTSGARQDEQLLKPLTYSATNSSEVRSTTSPRPASSVYSQQSLYAAAASDPRSQRAYSHVKQAPAVPSPKSWTGSFSDDDDDDEDNKDEDDGHEHEHEHGKSNSSVQTFPASKSETVYFYMPPMPAAPTRAAPVPLLSSPVPPVPPLPAAAAVTQPTVPSRVLTNASRAAAVHATYHLPQQHHVPATRSRRLKTITRSTPHTASFTPPSYSRKGTMNCQGRYLRIGTLRGPTPAEMAWVDGAMFSAADRAREKADEKNGAEKADREVEKGIKQVRKWLRGEKRETVEYVIEYMREEYGVDI